MRSLHRQRPWWRDPWLWGMEVALVAVTGFILLVAWWQDRLVGCWFLWWGC